MAGSVERQKNTAEDHSSTPDTCAALASYRMTCHHANPFLDYNKKNLMYGLRDKISNLLNGHLFYVLDQIDLDSKIRTKSDQG